MAVDFAGRDSEWHEAQLKPLRLHDSQNLINYYRRYPLMKSDGKFNYENWFIECTVLRGEGNSKYADAEVLKVVRIEQIIRDLLRLAPAHRIVKVGRMGSERVTYIFNQKNYDNLFHLISKYEYLIKDLNDKHGLTTSNKQTGGYF